jgi:molybdopterin converting factor subunit 1
MRVTIQLFARLREIAGAGEFDCEVPEGATVGEVWKTTETLHPGLAPLAGAVSSAVNDDFARTSATVRAGDRVAFLPPVSGGSDFTRTRS